MLALHDNVAVSIDGKRLHSFKSLRLHQPINDHHRFELSLDLDSVSERYVEGFKDGTEWLGKRLLAYEQSDGSPLFLGVVARVSARKDSLDGGRLCVSGFSTTYLLENGENCHSWLDWTLADIVGELCEKAGVKLLANPENRDPVGYVCQYNESDFDFIRRLAWKYKEWLYYDGTRLVFGKPELPDAVGLEFERNLISFETGVQTLARPAKVFSYVSKDDHGMAEPTPDKPSGLDELGHKAFRASMELFREPALQYAHSRVHHMKEMELYVKKKQEAETAESHYVECSTKGVWLSVGSVVKLSCSFGKRIGSVAEASMGEFLVIDVTHEVGDDRFYGNSFRAIPSVARSLPVRDVGRSVAETQVARVIGNADPDGKGRVQVQMNWQTGNMRTGWIRVMTPDGGGSESVSTNRGFVFIPEVGDHVLVGFRHGDPNRPYVMGSLFNGRTGKGGGEDNCCKSISTRSGCSLTLNDAEGSVTLHDKASGNGNSSVELNFDGDGNHKLKAASTVTTSVGKKGESILTMDSNGIIDLSGKSKVSIKVGDNVIEINGEENTINLTAQTINITAGSSTVTENGKSVLTPQASIRVSGNGNIQIEGKPVDINKGKPGLVNIK